MAKNIFEIGIFDESKSFVTTYTNEIFVKEFKKNYSFSTIVNSRRNRICL